MTDVRNGLLYHDYKSRLFSKTWFNYFKIKDITLSVQVLNDKNLSKLQAKKVLSLHKWDDCKVIE